MAPLSAYPGVAYPGDTYPSYVDPGTTAITLTVGGAAVDVTSRVLLDQGISITRGRQDQLSTIQASTCSFTLDNSDGGLDSSITSSIRYPIQVTTGVGDVRFTGRIDIWQRHWPGGGTEEQTVLVTCTDLWSDLERLGTNALSWLTINSYSPVCFYPLTEAASSDPRAFDASGNHAPDLIPRQLGNAGAISWGQGTQAPLDQSGIVRFDPSGDKIGWLLQGATPIHLPLAGTNAAWTMHCTLNTTQASKGVVVALSSASGAISTGGYGSGVWALSLPVPGYSGDIGLWYPDASSGETSAVGTGGTSPNSGTSVSLTLTYDGATGGKVWVNEHSTSLTFASVGALGTDLYLSVGGVRQVADTSSPMYSGTALLSGAVGNVAVWDHVLTDTQITQVVRSEQTGITDAPQTAIERWLGWTTSQSPETGSGVTSPAYSLDAPTTTGTVWKTTQTGSVATLLREAEQSEGGMAFVDRSGTVQFLARHTSRTLPALTVDVELVNPDVTVTTDWRLAVDSATATSTSGDHYAYSLGTGTGTTTSVVSLATTADQVRYATQWVVNGGQLTTKLPTLTLDMTTLDSTTQAAAAALDIGSPITLQRLPSRPNPDPYLVQGYQEQISHADWTITFNVTSTGTGSGYDLLKLDDTTYGALDSTHRLDW